MLPRLLHPTQVTVRLRRTDQTLYDEDAREPIGKVARETDRTLVAQISWKSQTWKSEVEGKEEDTDGYCLFRRKDLSDLGIEVKEGDQIVSMGTGAALVSVNLYIYMIQRRGHYPDQGGHTLVKAWFQDKGPVRAR